MKRIGLIKDKFLSIDRLNKIVDYLCRQEKKKNWTITMVNNWSRFLIDRDKNIERLYNELVNMEYRFHRFNTFTRYECGKRRLVYASCPEDQVVDTLLDECLKYVFIERKHLIHDHAYGSIKGKGQHKLRSIIIQKLKGRGNVYVAVCDTHHYYPTIRHDIMMNTLRKHIKDRWVLWLSELTMCRLPGNIGMALGLASANILGHVYHASVDWDMTIKYGVKDYYRFCDDKIMISEDPKYLHSMVRILRDEIENLGQTLKPNWRIANVRNERIEWLGGFINTKNARLKTKSRRRIEKRRIKKELKFPYNNIERVERTWAGIKGGLTGLSTDNLINYWESKYPEFFERLESTKAKKKEIREEKDRLWKLEIELSWALDCRSVYNKSKYPIDFGLIQVCSNNEITYV